MSRAIYFERANKAAWDHPFQGCPSNLALLFRDLRDDATFEIFGGQQWEGRRFWSESLSTANTTLRITAPSANRLGEVVVSYGGASSAGIPWNNLKASHIQSAANSIAAVAAAGGVEVTGEGTRFLVRWRKVGAVTDITISGLGAIPDVNSTTSTVTTGDGSTREVQVIDVEPAAIQLFDSDDWSATGTATMSDTRTAGTAGSYEVTTFEFDRAPKGGHWTITNGTWKTDAISVFATAQQVEDALNKKAGASQFRVRKGGAFEWQVTQIGAIGDATNISSDDAGVLSHAGIKGTIDYAAILKYGFGKSDYVDARAILRLVWTDGHVVEEIADIKIPLDGAPAVAATLSQTANNVIGVYPATEAISASRFVNIYDNAGTDSIRAASAANSYDADGWIEDAVANGDSVTVYGTTGTLSGLSGLTTSNTEYLGEAGAVTESAPIAGIRQDLGEAISDGSMTVNIQPPVVL